MKQLCSSNMIARWFFRDVLGVLHKELSNLSINSN
uniref:Uncharacterized protein n=1 Tax=Anguilla anguilla TaxID=7936 RepID=A0A0E9SRV9_ANGAN